MIPNKIDFRHDVLRNLVRLGNVVPHETDLLTHLLFRMDGDCAKTGWENMLDNVFIPYGTVSDGRLLNMLEGDQIVERINTLSSQYLAMDNLLPEADPRYISCLLRQQLIQANEPNYFDNPENVQAFLKAIIKTIESFDSIENRKSMIRSFQVAMNEIVTLPGAHAIDKWRLLVGSATKQELANHFTRDEMKASNALKNIFKWTNILNDPQFAQLAVACRTAEIDDKPSEIYKYANSLTYIISRFIDVENLTDKKFNKFLYT